MLAARRHDEIASQPHDTQGLEAAALAQAFNIPLAMGGDYPHMNMHLHGDVPKARILDLAVD
jgi:hypothetical protein